MNWLQRMMTMGTGKKTYDVDDALSILWSEMLGTSVKKVNSAKGALEQRPWVSRAVRVLSQSSADVPLSLIHI